jgi:hypothetical protein
MLPQDIIETIALYVPKASLITIILLRKNSLSDYFWGRRLTIDYPGWVNPLTLKYKHLYRKYSRLKTGYAKYFKIQDMDLKDPRIITDIAQHTIYLDTGSAWMLKLDEQARNGDIIRLRRKDEESYYIWYNSFLQWCGSHKIKITLPKIIKIFDEFPLTYWCNIDIYISHVSIDNQVNTELSINTNLLDTEYILFNGNTCIFHRHDINDIIHNYWAVDFMYIPFRLYQ